MAKEIFIKKLESAKNSLSNIKYNKADRLVLTDKMKPWEIRDTVNDFMQKSFVRSVVLGIEVYLRELGFEKLDKYAILMVKERFDCVIDVLPYNKYHYTKSLSLFINKLYKNKYYDYHLTLDKNDNLWILREDNCLNLKFEDDHFHNPNKR